MARPVKTFWELKINFLGRISVALCVAAIVACSWLSPMDKPALQQVDSGLKRALVTYSTARLLHGAVSVLQGTQVNASPAGVGATLTPGQVLVPAAEMLKQFSDLMLLVCVSFGIQKLMITMGGFQALSITLSVTAIGWTLHGLWQKRPPAWLTKMFIVLLMVRFAIPLTVLGTDVLFQTFMAHEYTSSQAAISSVTTAQNPPASPAAVTPGFLGKIKSWMDQPITNAIGHYEEIKSAVERAAAHMVTLIGIFVLQTLVIPLLLLWGLYGLARIGFQLPRQPVAMRHPA